MDKSLSIIGVPPNGQARLAQPAFALHACPESLWAAEGDSLVSRMLLASEAEWISEVGDPAIFSLHKKNTDPFCFVS